ncbi:cysteine-rich venom protein latisemin-like [Paramacrobiotus metropolitanus]|uniref:cysteine-rich venom protein latisemin-like n=1 Tax=Paramacrobiotus metropolitanus TaxID=2943436 RepID=UPI0024463661|nr:cysteine-rich venom protein latisemin-like [Paramacrobiotus metropolitanus]
MTPTRFLWIAACFLTFAVTSHSARRRTSSYDAGVDANAILNLHNYLRKTVSARNMRTLRWSNDAARVAQRWADTCPSGHDRNSARGIPGFSSCGQNISWRPRGDTSWKKAIMQWYDEVKDFRYCRRPTGVVGHYTQLMWADTSVVGCAIKTGCNTLGPNTVVFVCNYCDAGNIMMSGNPNSQYCPWRQ